MTGIGLRRSITFFSSFYSLGAEELELFMNSIPGGTLGTGEKWFETELLLVTCLQKAVPLDSSVKMEKIDRLVAVVYTGKLRTIPLLFVFVVDGTAAHAGTWMMMMGHPRHGAWQCRSVRTDETFQTESDQRIRPECRCQLARRTWAELRVGRCESGVVIDQSGPTTCEPAPDSC